MMSSLTWLFEIEYAILSAAIGIFLFWSGYWCVHILALVYGKFRLHRKVPELDPETMAAQYPGVSIIKPLVGVDSNLATNLETFFTLKYPRYEVLFCIQTDSDPALMLVQTLCRKYPLVESKIFAGGKNVGLNPKINNMMPGWETAQYDLVLISDAGIRMRDDTLLDMVTSMKENIGMVTQMPFTCDRAQGGFAATLEKVYFGTAHARIYLSADAVGVVCATGMSSLIRKSALDEVGGIAAFSPYIAEDYFFAHSLHSRGHKCTISSQPAWQNGGLCQVSQFQERLGRWAKLRFAMLPHTILLEPLQECLLLGLLASWSAAILFEWNSLIFLLIHMLCWMLSDYLLLRVVQNGSLPFSKFEFMVSWLYREITAFPLFLRALWDQRIRWRTGSYKLKWGGLAEPLLADEIAKK